MQVCTDANMTPYIGNFFGGMSEFNEVIPPHVNEHYMYFDFISGFDCVTNESPRMTMSGRMPNMMMQNTFNSDHSCEPIDGQCGCSDPLCLFRYKRSEPVFDPFKISSDEFAEYYRELITKKNHAELKRNIVTIISRNLHNHLVTLVSVYEELGKKVQYGPLIFHGLLSTRVCHTKMIDFLLEKYFDGLIDLTIDSLDPLVTIDNYMNMNYYVDTHQKKNTYFLALDFTFENVLYFLRKCMSLDIPLPEFYLMHGRLESNTRSLAWVDLYAQIDKYPGLKLFFSSGIFQQLTKNIPYLLKLIECLIQNDQKSAIPSLTINLIRNLKYDYPLSMDKGDMIDLLKVTRENNLKINFQLMYPSTYLDEFSIENIIEMSDVKNTNGI
jgi:hypothetical protein